MSEKHKAIFPAAVNYAIIAIGAVFLAVCLYPVFSQYKGTRRDGNLTHVKLIGLALLMYVEDYNGRLPTGEPAPIRKALVRYGGSDSLWQTVPASGSMFRFNRQLEGKILDRIPHPDSVVMVYEDPADDNKGGRYLCFADSHAKWVTSEQWDDLLKAHALEGK
jgi:hypothetical protein